MYRYIIYIACTIVMYNITLNLTSWCSLSIPDMTNKPAIYSKPNIKYIIVCAVKVYMLSLIDNANNTNTNPEQNSNIKYLGRIFSLQYLHFEGRELV